jgi:hypothetical protein
MAAARAFAGLNEGNFNFVYVSGEGATHNPGRFTQTFARVKGEAELSLIGLMKESPYSKTLQVYSARPGGVDGHLQPEVWNQALERKSFLWKAMMAVLIPPLNLFYKNMMSPTPELGKALTELAMRGTEPLSGKGIEADGRVVRNIALRRMGGLPT